MTTLAEFAHELIGLFVEDGALALAIIAVVIGAAIVAALLPGVAWAGGAVLLFGCLGVLFANVMRATRR
jgi:hypothetical protein